MNSELAKADSLLKLSDLILLIEQMDESIALFDQDDRLEVCNSNFVQLWQIRSDWLQQKPTCNEILDNLVETGYWLKEQTQQFQSFLVQILSLIHI